MRQFAGFGTAEETNERFRYLLDHGQTGLSTAFDMPSLMGHDSDHPRRWARSGARASRSTRVAGHGDAVRRDPAGRGQRVDDDQRAGGDHARVLRRGGRAPGRRPASGSAGTIQTDILKEYIAQKEWCFPVDPAMRLVTDMVEWCSREMPRWHPIIDQRLSHPRGRIDGRPGAGVHARRTGSPTSSTPSRAGSTSTTSRRGCRSSSTPRSTSSRRSRSTARRGGSGRATAGHVRRAQARVVADALPHPDGRGVADRPAAAQQHRAHRDRGARRRARRDAVAAHELVRRGARAAHRGGGADRAPHAADHRPRDRRDQHDRPARRRRTSSRR